MKRVRAALVGAGPRGRGGHAKALANAENIDFAAICDVDEAVGRPAAEEYGVEYIPDTKQLYARDDIVAVGMCVPTPYHHELAMEAISAGRHLLTEKPMAGSLAQAREMMDAAEAAGLCAAISYQNRLSPVMLKMKEICEQVRPVQIMYAPQRGVMRDKYMTPRPFDGIMDYISHGIDAIPFLAGREPTAVFASMRRNTWTDSGAIDVIGVQIELGRGDDKTIGYLASSMGGGEVPQRLDIVGERGVAVATGKTIVFTTEENPCELRAKRDLHTLSLEGAAGDPTTDQYERWAACILDPEMALAPAASYRDGYNALLVALAAVEAGQSGERVSLAEFAAAAE